MTAPEAAIEVSYLKGLFPKTTREQEDWWHRKFQDFPSTAVRRAINRFATKHSEWVDRTGLLALIDDERRRDETRMIQATKSSDNLRRIADEQRIHTRNQMVDRIVNSFTDERLLQLRESVLAYQNSGVRGLLSGRDPRKSARLRDLIYEHLHMLGELPADPDAIAV